jgi:hypothetical protein
VPEPLTVAPLELAPAPVEPLLVDADGDLLSALGEPA